MELMEEIRKMRYGNLQYETSILKESRSILM